MQPLTLIGLVGAICLGANGHFFTYDDSDNTHHFRPSFYVSKSPPKPGHRVGHLPRSHYTPSYYISKTLPKWPNKPHGTGAVYDYPAAPSSYYRGLESMESMEYYSPVIIRQGRSKSKKSAPVKGGWWYQWKNGKLYSGRWGAPPPPGLEKEHYIYGGGHGWGQSYHSQGGGWGWPSHGHGGHGHGGHGHGGHGHGGHGHRRGHGHGGHGHGHGSHHQAFPHHHGPAKHNHGHHGIGPGGGYGGGGGWGWGGGKTNGWGW